jgi:hypothetical protein
LARSYASSNGRFLSPDPLEGIVGDPQSWNRYAYVENDPINLTDPSGQGFWEDLGFAIADVFLALVPGGQAALPGVLGVEASAEAGNVAVTLDDGTQVVGPWGGSSSSHVGERVWALSRTGPWYPYVQPPNPTCGDCDGIGAGGTGASSQGPGGDPSAVSVPGGGPGGGGNAPATGSIWDECGTGCMGTLSKVGNFSAGAGEFLSAGLTSWINRKTGAASVVNTSSGAYRAGWWTGAGLTVATSAAGVVTSQAVNGGKYGIIYGRNRMLYNSLLDSPMGPKALSLANSGFVRFGWYWEETVDAVGLRIGSLHLPFWRP